MTTNLDLSNSDKKILSLICEDLSDKKLSLTLENIRKHYLFDKIEQKDLFVGSDSMYPISIRISQPEPDKLSIEIVGSKICVKNMLHAKFLEGCITEFSQKLTGFTHFTKQIGLEDFLSPDTASSVSKEKNLVQLLKEIWNKN